MPPLIRDRAIATGDGWTYPDAPEAATAKRRVLPLAGYLAAAQAGAAGPDLGVLLKPEDHDLEPLRPWIARLPIVVVHFPSAGDGRGFSQATLLRERHGYRGELRARGRVQVDQIWFMARCGFDAFDLAPGEDPALAIAQLDRFSVAYQPGPEGALSRPRLRYGE
jgi:uncharacterized protein (DUF934 family)